MSLTHEVTVNNTAEATKKNKVMTREIGSIGKEETKQKHILNSVLKMT